MEEPSGSWESPIEDGVFATTEGSDALLFRDDDPVHEEIDQTEKPWSIEGEADKK